MGGTGGTPVFDFARTLLRASGVVVLLIRSFIELSFGVSPRVGRGSRMVFELSDVVKGGDRVNAGLIFAAILGRDDMSLTEGVARPSECWYCMLKVRQAL